ncbi:MAG: AraD1 family protein [Gammaproteobacteria bacterium]
MTMRLIQLATDTERFVALLEPNRSARRLHGVASTYDLAMSAVHEGSSLQSAATARLTEQRIDLGELIAGSSTGVLRWLPPIDHPDPAHLYLTGTGLTHLGSAASRDKMHAKATAAAAQSDSMRMFLMGLEGGKAADGAVGVQPEWFYKGDGSSIVACGEPLRSPSFALDGGEEPEIAGVYLIDPDGNPRRLGFCLANEFSDHITERGNYLWLAHSKLRPAALGAELLTGALPDDVKGMSRILRGGKVIWESAFLTGEINMSHWIANLEHHHFKYPLFRRPGDVHVHFFGTATLSFSDGVRAQLGDVFEIEADAFTVPLRNPLAPASTAAVQPKPL